MNPAFAPVWRGCQVEFRSNRWRWLDASGSVPAIGRSGIGSHNQCAISAPRITRSEIDEQLCHVIPVLFGDQQSSLEKLQITIEGESDGLIVAVRLPPATREYVTRGRASSLRDALGSALEKLSRKIALHRGAGGSRRRRPSELPKLQEAAQGLGRSSEF
jgi:hypothetical protein